MFAAMSRTLVGEKASAKSVVESGSAECNTETADVDAMQARFPNAARAELLRFYRATRDVKKAIAMFTAHEAFLVAHPLEELAAARQKIPEFFIRPCPGKALDGTPILLVQGARYDKATSTEEYVLAVMDELERALCRDDTTQWTVLLDIRCQEGWANLAATEMLPFFKALNTMATEHYPERIHRVVIYPMPSVVSRLWYVVKQFIDTATRKKVVLLSGPSEEGGPCPKELGLYVTLDALPSDAQDIHKELRSESEAQLDAVSETAVALET